MNSIDNQIIRIIIKFKSIMKDNMNGDPEAPIKKDHDQSIEPNFDDDFSDNKSSYRLSVAKRQSLK